MKDDPSSDESKTGKGSLIFVLVGIVVVGVALLLAVPLRASKEEGLKDEARAREESVKAGPVVNYVSAKPAKPERTVGLVGEARPCFQSTIYAKVSGYLREITVDYRDEVTEGQVLATIESPELDRQYDAAVEDARNKEELAKRGRALLPQKATSIEDAQNRDFAARVAKATAASLRAQKDHEVIRAPFAETITARYADPGALLQNATTTQTAALPLVTVSRLDRLKVCAYADQSTANYFRVGNHAEIWDVTGSEERVPARVSRTSVQLNARTRTLLLQLDVDNRKRSLVPESFVRVALTIKTPPRIEVPVEALVYRSGVPYVAVLAGNNTVAFHQVVIASATGKRPASLQASRKANVWL
jgi:RND family efflux transporter MFP subunit